MGRPVNKRYFGPDVGKIKVLFNNGSSVSGYIVKQVSDTVFDLSQDGTSITRCQLAQNTADATSLAEGYCTIQISTVGGLLYVRHLSSVLAITTEDLVFSWIEGLVTGSKGLLGLVGDALPDPDITFDFLTQTFVSHGNTVALTDLMYQTDFFGPFDPTATTTGLINAQPGLYGDALAEAISGASFVFHIQATTNVFFGFVTADSSVQEGAYCWTSTPDQGNNTGVEGIDDVIYSAPSLITNAMNKVAITITPTHIAMSVNGSPAQAADDFVRTDPIEGAGIFITGDQGSAITAIEMYPVVTDDQLSQF